MRNTQLNLSPTSRLGVSLLVLLTTLWVCGPSAFCQINTTWKGGAGNWNDSTKWTNGVPNGNFNVFIDGGNSVASPVALNINASINNLTIDKDDSPGFNNGTVLTVNGTSISNAGSMTLNSTGNFTELVIGSSAVTLSGGGTVTMSNNANNLIFGAATGDTLTNQETIQGSGNIGDGHMTLVNSGTINASQPTPLTIAANGGATNTGTIEATGGTLLVTGTAMNNIGGTISASGQALRDQFDDQWGDGHADGRLDPADEQQRDPERHVDQQCDGDDRSAGGFRQHPGRHHHEPGGWWRRWSIIRASCSRGSDSS